MAVNENLTMGFSQSQLQGWLNSNYGDEAQLISADGQRLYYSRNGSAITSVPLSVIEGEYTSERLIRQQEGSVRQAYNTGMGVTYSPHEKAQMMAKDAEIAIGSIQDKQKRESAYRDLQKAMNSNDTGTVQKLYSQVYAG